MYYSSDIGVPYILSYPIDIHKRRIPILSCPLAVYRMHGLLFFVHIQEQYSKSDKHHFLSHSRDMITPRTTAPCATHKQVPPTSIQMSSIPSPEQGQGYIIQIHVSISNTDAGAAGATVCRQAAIMKIAWVSCMVRGVIRSEESCVG